MKKLTILLLIIFNCLAASAQRGKISNNFFGHLEFNSLDGMYKATLEKNIFNGLEFYDNSSNRITFDEKYLAKHFPGIMRDNEGKTNFLRNLVRKYSRDKNYRLSHVIDMFGKEKVEDNRGYSSERGTDIFGHEYHEESGKFGTASIKRNLQGVLEYDRNDFSASLGKDFHRQWVYEDSQKNRIEFNPSSWEKMIKRFKSDKEIMFFLIEQLTDFYDEDDNTYHNDY
ncbi:hypothetical protein [Sphingobacterium sp. NPDC055346]